MRTRENWLGAERLRSSARGARGSGRGALLPAARPARRAGPPHSSGFPTHSPSKSPQSPGFSRAPPPPGLEKLFFTPSWSLICCGGKKAAFVGRGAARGAGGGEGARAIVCPAAARLGPPGVGAAGRGARAGPEWGARGAGGRGVLGEGVEEKATRAHKPIVLLAPSAPGPDTGTLRSHQGGRPGGGCALGGEAAHSGGGRRARGTRRACK